MSGAGQKRVKGAAALAQSELALDPLPAPDPAGGGRRAESERAHTQ